jgi:TonB family protein
MKDEYLVSSFGVSTLIHLVIIPVTSVLMAGPHPFSSAGRLDVSLIDIPRIEKKEEPTVPEPEPKKLEKIKPPKLVYKTDLAKVEPTEIPPAVEETPPPPALTAPGPEKGSVISKAPPGEAEGGEAGVGNLFAGGDVQVVPGAGVGGGAGGTGITGLGRGEKGDGSGGGGSGEGLAPLARPLGGYQVKPRYPESARRQGAQGITLLRVRVLENGRVGEVLVEKSAGHRDLDVSAADAVKKWLFEPARKGKEPIPVWVLLPVKFELQ